MPRLRVHNFLGHSRWLRHRRGSVDRSGVRHRLQSEFLPWFEKAKSFFVPPTSRARCGTGAERERTRSLRRGAVASVPTLWAAIRIALATGPWPQDGWRGWWGEEPLFGTPGFVMTHWEREPLTVGNTTFHFVSGTPAEVLQRAQKAAG